MLFFIFTLFSLITNSYPQQIGNVKKNDVLSLPIIDMGKVIQTGTTIDANWRWIHDVNGYTNCYDNNWNKQYCPDPITCSKNCALEGVDQNDYKNIYGVTTNGNSLQLNYVTNSNVGSRMYLLDEGYNQYKMFNLINKQFVMDVDVSKIPCGLNGAVYFVEMLSKGINGNVKYGLGYGDAQCPTDIKYINGFVNTNNTGTCSIEMDIWEANSMATQIAPHSCNTRSVFSCTNDKDCGRGNFRYQGLCDKDGTSYNPYREGRTNFYGPGSKYQVDTTKPFTVITQFFSSNNKDDGNLVGMRQLYRQNGKLIEGGTLTDEITRQIKEKYSETNHFEQLGGFKRMGESFKRGMVLVMSLWDDTAVNMLWLDSTFPKGSTELGSKRGPCPDNRQGVDWLRRTYPDSKVIYSNIKVEAIEPKPTTPTPTPTTPTPTPTTPTPTPTPPTPKPPIPNPSSSCNYKIKCSECILMDIDVEIS
jgi:cellulose 1,4-beta-cellobiosidase